MRDIKINNVSIGNPQVHSDPSGLWNYIIIDEKHIGTLRDQFQKNAALRVKYGDNVELTNDIGAVRRTVVSGVQFNDKSLKIIFKI